MVTQKQINKAYDDYEAAKADYVAQSSEAYGDAGAAKAACDVAFDKYLKLRREYVGVASVCT